MRNDTKGFTLIEIVITLIIGSILGAMLATYMGSHIIHSVDPVIRVKSEYALNEVMENINADYRKLLIEDADPLGTLQTDINNNAYGTYSVVQNEFIEFNQGSEVQGGDRILKVSLSHNDQTFTTLFTR